MDKVKEVLAVINAITVDSGSYSMDTNWITTAVNHVVIIMYEGKNVGLETSAPDHHTST